MNIRPVWKLLFLFLVSNALLLGWNGLRRRGDGRLHITFLDVGQGDGAVVVTPSGKVIVLDTGVAGEEGEEAGGDGGERVVAPFLQARGIGRIDTLILSHPHADHIGGAATLLRRFPTDLLMDNGEPSRSPFVTRYLQAARTRRVPVKAARRGQTLDYGDGVHLDILAPTPDEAQYEAETNGAANNASVVVRISYGRTAFLFMGDAEGEEEADLVQSGLPLACDVLKAGHHGSHTSTTPALFASAHPRDVILSVGAHNLYGHPSRDVLERLNDGHARVFRTDRNGAVQCVSDGVVVQTRPLLPSTP